MKSTTIGTKSHYHIILRMFVLCPVLSLSLSAWCVAQDVTPPPAQEQGKTPEQWLSLITSQNADEIAREADHPTDLKLMYGAVRSFWGPAYYYQERIAEWPAAYRNGFLYFQDWWKQTGLTQFTKWRQDGFPVLADRQYVIFHAMAMGMYTMLDMTKKENQDIAIYGDKIIKRGKEIVLSGCTGHPLVQSDIDALRLFAMYSNRIWGWPSSRTLPCYQNWMDPRAPTVGAEAPDFFLQPFKEIAGNLSTASPFDELDVFRPVIMCELLSIMSGYEPAADHRVFPVQPRAYDHRFKNPLQLASFRNKKPVLFMCVDATDTWSWSGCVAPCWGPLREAIKDQVEVFFVHTSVTDQYMPLFPGAHLPGAWATHPANAEQRAYTIKRCYMLYPTLSVPYLLDDAGEHVLNGYQADGGASPSFIVDRHGVLSFDAYHRPECSDYLGSDLDHYDAASLPARSTHLMNLVECNLKQVLTHGGLWGGDMHPIVSDWRLASRLENTTVAAIDVALGSLTVLDQDKKALALSVDEHTRVQLKRRNVSMSSILVKNPLFVYFDRPVPPATLGHARLITDGPGWNSYWSTGSWVSAMVQSIDLAGGTFTATVNLHESDCPGVDFWKHANAEEVSCFGPSAAAVQARFHHLIEQSDERMTIHCDRATEIFLDGMTSRLSAMKIGDTLGIQLPDDFDHTAVRPTFVRIYRY